LLLVIARLVVSRQCDTRSCWCRFLFAVVLIPLSRVTQFAERSFANVRRHDILLDLIFSAFPDRISSCRTPPTDDRRHDHVAEHSSCARWRLPDTRRRMVSHRNYDYVCPVTSAVPPTCGLLLLLRIVLLMHSVQNSLQQRPIAFRAWFRCPLFLFSSSGRTVMDTLPPRGAHSRTEFVCECGMAFGVSDFCVSQAWGYGTCLSSVVRN